VHGGFAGLAGPLRIGITLGLADAVVVPAVDALHRHDPDIVLHLTTARSLDLKKQVVEGALDAAVVMTRREQGHEQPTADLLGVERVAVVAGAALPCPPRCALADLVTFPWVINPDGCGFRTQLDRSLVQCGHALEVAAETWGHGLQLALVARGTGLGLVPRRLILESPHVASLRIIDVHDFGPALNVWLMRTAVIGPNAAAIEVVAAAVRHSLEG
jgi:DNA-binding transcriptional LysR family regulator